MEVAFVGIGAMGGAMAPNLAEFLAGDASGTYAKSLLVYNRSREKATKLSEKFPNLMLQVTDLRSIADRASIVFTMLAHDDALRDTISDLLQYDGKTSVIVDCSTVQPETTEELAAEASKKGIDYLACPVLGRPDAATARKLVMFLSGTAVQRDRVVPLVNYLGRKTIDLGPETSKAHRLKLVANFHIVAAIEMISEGMTLAEKNGIDRGIYLELINEGFPSPIISGYAGRMARDEFGSGAGFSVSLGLKDTGHMRRLAESSGVHAPLLNTAIEHLVQARAQGHGDEDWSAIIKSVRKNSGL